MENIVPEVNVEVVVDSLFRFFLRGGIGTGTGADAADPPESANESEDCVNLFSFFCCGAMAPKLYDGRKDEYYYLFIYLFTI